MSTENTYNSPAEVGFAAQTEGWSQERFDAEMAKFIPPADTAPDPEPVPTPDPAPEPAPAPAPEPNPGGGDPAPLPADLPDEIKQRLERLEQLEKEIPTLTDYKKKWEDNQDLLSVLPSIENPFATEEDRVINNLKKKSGILDHVTVSKIATVKQEQLLADPIGAIALAEAITNPTSANHMGFDRLKRAIELDLDVTGDASTWDDNTKLKVERKALNALKTIEEKKEEFSKGTQDIVSLTASFRESRQKAEENGRQWDTIIPTLHSRFNTVEEEIEIEGKKIKATVSLRPEVVKHFVQQLSPTIRSYEFSDKGKQEVENTILSGLRLAAQKDLITAAVKEFSKTFTAEERERILKEHANAGPVKRDDKPNGSTGGKYKSPAEKAYEEKYGSVNLKA